jgi:hypothetical protein
MNEEMRDVQELAATGLPDDVQDSLAAKVWTDPAEVQEIGLQRAATVERMERREVAHRQRMIVLYEEGSRAAQAICIAGWITFFAVAGTLCAQAWIEWGNR